MFMNVLRIFLEQSVASVILELFFTCFEHFNRDNSGSQA